MSDINSVRPSMLRIDTSRASEYLYADKPKLSFMQKLGRGVGKVMSALGPVGAAVASFIPGFGLPLAAGLYGASQLATDATNAALAKDAQQMAQYNQQVANAPISMPGFFEGLREPEIQTNFIAPSEYSSGIQETIVNREMAQNQALSTF